jgi:hypothetical protein
MSISKNQVEKFETKEGETELLSHYRIAKNKYGLDVKVPVVDVRDGLSYRVLAHQMIKAGNRSRWINYNQYHTSRKKY